MQLDDIKKQVTHFSLQLSSASQEEEVVVGGEIKSLIPSPQADDPMHILLLDDQVGQSHVFISDRMLKAYLPHFEVGNTIFVQGFVSFVSRKHGVADKEPFVYGYALAEPAKEASLS